MTSKANTPQNASGAPLGQSEWRLRSRYTDSELAATHWWSAGATRIAFPRRRKTFDVRLGFIGSDELMAGLDPECDLVVLTPANWRLAIETEMLEAVLIEPCMRSQNSVWDHHFADASAIDDMAMQFLDLCKSRGVPVLGWIRSDVAYYDLHAGFARHFDATFCCDHALVKKLRDNGLPAKHLPAAIQPSIFNPFTELSDPDVEAPPILFDGWTSVIDSPALAEGLKGLVPLGLGIIESRAYVKTNRLEIYPWLQEAILGGVTTADRLFLLKRAAILVQSEENRTRGLAEQQALEAAACRTVVLYKGSLQAADLRKKFAIEFPDWDSLCAYASELLNDQFAWMRQAQLAWREVHQTHAMDDRVYQLILTANPEGKERASEKATIVTPTIRPELLEKVLSQFRSQSWPHKELIVVVNSSSTEAWNKALLSNDETIVLLPKDYWAAAALNVGAQRSKGTYIFRMDDDDIYGRNYVLDAMLHARSVDPDIMGKEAPFVYAEEKKALIWRTWKKARPTVFSASRFGYQATTLAGFTHVARRDLLLRRGYPEFAYGTADASFLYREKEHGEVRMALLDPLNAVFERRGNLDSHTWRKEHNWDGPEYVKLPFPTSYVLV